MLREITGIGKGFYIAIGNGFAETSSWANYLPGSDRLILDSHPYFAFDGNANNQPISATGPDGRPGGVWPQQACQTWGSPSYERYIFEASNPSRVHEPSLMPVTLVNRRLVSASQESTATDSTIAGSGFVDRGMTRQ